MKILQINTVYKTGSTGKIAKDLNDLIIKQGWESYVAYGRGNWNDVNTIKIGTKFDMYIHGIGTRIFDKHGLYSKKATIEFIKKIDKLNIDIFHLNNIHGYYLHYPTLFEYLKDKKVIWTLHDCWSFTGHCSYYDYIGCDKWQEHCNNCPQLRQYPASFIFDNSYNNFKLKKKYFMNLKNLILITPSNWLAKEVQKSFLNIFNTEVIHNGIDLSIFKPIRSKFRQKYNLENKFLILGVSNVWEKRKGLEYFIRLLRKLKDDEKIILVGLNDKQLKKLPSNILGVKRTNSQIELAEIYSGVDLFLNPTLEEVLGLTNLEAMACGTPVITFNTGGSVETIDEDTGIIAEKDSLEGLLEAIGKIRKIGKNNFSKACRDRVVTYFDKDRNFKMYLEIYKNLYENINHNSSP